jgi:hypothetical protein
MGGGQTRAEWGSGRGSEREISLAQQKKKGM